MLKANQNQFCSPGCQPYRRASSQPSCALFFVLLVVLFFGAREGTAMASTNSGVQILQQIKTVFIIAMENHNFTQPNPNDSPMQLFGNPAAPYLNSLVTPGNSNSAQVSYATKYYNVGNGTHPSEPNYIWAEAGTDFDSHTDADPSSGNGNFFDAPHLTRQMNTAGISWKNYQEDLEYSSGAAYSAIGYAPKANPYYSTGDFYYGVKHNPMAFFTDTVNQNVFPLTNFFRDLTNNAIGRYNWITPNMYNDQHSGLSGGFVYHGVGYAGDQAGVAQGDNFLATIIPWIMASAAYQDHGVIILHWDESEIGDGANYTLPEIIISPLAKGNAYACSLPLSHSSDVKTLEEIFGLALLTNSIPAGEVFAAGGYSDVVSANDLSDLFQWTGPIPFKIVSGQKMPNPGGFQLTFSGPVGQTYKLLASDTINSSASNWQVLSTGTFTNTNAIFPDLTAPAHSSRFYVIKSP